MIIINKLLELVVTILNDLLPNFTINNDFIIRLDDSLVFIINMLHGVGYLIHLDVFSLCLVVIFGCDHFGLAMRIAQFILKLVRG